MIHIWLHIDLRVNFWKKIIYLFFAGHLGRQIIRVQNFVKNKKKIAGQMILSLSKKKSKWKWKCKRYAFWTLCAECTYMDKRKRVKSPLILYQ